MGVVCSCCLRQNRVAYGIRREREGNHFRDDDDGRSKELEAEEEEGGN